MTELVSLLEFFTCVETPNNYTEILIFFTSLRYYLKV